MKRWLSLLATVMLLISSGAGGTFASQTVPNKKETGAKKEFSVTAEKDASPIIPDTLVVKYKGSLPTSIQTKYGGKVISKVPSLGYTVVKFKDEATAKKAYVQYKALKGVSSVTPSVRYQTYSTITDPKVSEQYHISMLNIAKAQALAGKNRVVVAVIDQGIDRNHPEFKDQLLPSYNVLNPMNSPRPDFHGTHVAGIIAARKGNSDGGYGINPKASILPIDVFDRGWGTSDYTIAQGILYAVEKKAKVINMSLGGSMPSLLLEEAVQKAVDAGIVVVAAAGNTGSDMKSYPAALEGVISVGAVDKTGKLADFSSYGATVDLVAPGADVYSTIYDYEKKSGYAELSGTSMATPVVAGIASLLLSKNPKLTPAQVEYILKKTAKDVGAKGFDTRYGFGLVNPVAALGFDTKTLPTLTKALWTKKDILAKAISLSGKDTYKLTGVFTNPLEQKWYQLPVTKGDMYQITLQESAVFDSKLLIQTHQKYSSTQKMEVNDMQEGGTEGYLYKAPFTGILTVGVKDISGNYDLKGSNQSQYALQVEKVAIIPEDESTIESPIVIQDLPYSSKGTTQRLVGENGDDDYFAFESKESGMMKLTVSGNSGQDTSIELMQVIKDAETNTVSNQPINFINQNGFGKGEETVLQTDVNSRYLIKVSNKYEAYMDSWWGESIAPKPSENVRQNIAPYTVNLADITMPADEDGIGNIYDMMGEEEGASETKDVNEGQEYNGDSEIISYLDENALPYQIGKTVSGNVQTYQDQDWYRFEANKTGIYTFEFGPVAKHMVRIYRESTNNWDGKEITVLDQIANNFSNTSSEKVGFSSSMFTPLKQGERYFICVDNEFWGMTGFSVDPYSVKGTFLTSGNDKYEDNDSYKQVKDLPGFEFTGDLSKYADEDVFKFKPKHNMVYGLTFTALNPDSKLMTKFPKELFSKIYGAILIVEDKNQNNNLDAEEQELAKAIYYGDYAYGTFGSHAFKANKTYFIIITGYTETYQSFSLMPYKFSMKKLVDVDEDKGSIVKKNIPSKPIGLKSTAKGEWRKTGLLNAGIVNGDADWYSLKLDKDFKGTISFLTGKETDGVVDIYQNGKLVVHSDRYFVGDSEIVPVNLKAGTYHLKVTDANGNASHSPYTLLVKSNN